MEGKKQGETAAPGTARRLTEIGLWTLGASKWSFPTRGLTNGACYAEGLKRLCQPSSLHTAQQGGEPPSGPRRG